MQTLRTLIAYFAATLLLVGGLSGGAALLVQADASAPAPARVAPIPPRIAESIERKSLVVSIKETTPAQLPTAAPAPIPMQQANVSLTTHAPTFSIRELSAPAQAQRAPRKRERTDRSVRSASARPQSQVAEAPRMGRTDFPY